MNIDLDLNGVEELQDTLEEMKEEAQSEEVWEVGSTAEYGAILEFGRGPIEAPEGSALKFEIDGETVFAKRVEGHPPYPWFRPAVREFEANPKRFLLDNTDWNSLEEIPSMDVLVKSVALALENQMTDNVSADSATGRSPGTNANHPKRDTGNLANSIQAKRVK